MMTIIGLFLGILARKMEDEGMGRLIMLHDHRTKKALRYHWYRG